MPREDTWGRIRVSQEAEGGARGGGTWTREEVSMFSRHEDCYFE